MTTSGRAARIASVTARASNTSSTAGFTPARASSRPVSAERVVPVTSCPACSRSGTSRRPMAPEAPARNTRMALCYAWAHAWSRDGMARLLRRKFFARSVHEVAPELIGATLLFNGVGGVIVEVEAYHHTDPAAHSFNGETARNPIMFGPPAYAYVYPSY